MKGIIILGCFLYCFAASAQNSKEIKLSFGVNQSVLHPDVTQQRMLPDGSIVSGLSVSSQGNSGFNGSLTGAVSILKSENWKFRTGINFQTLRFNTVVGAVGKENEYRFLFDHKLNQIDIPILFSYEIEKTKLSFGGDFGIIKAIAIWGDVYPLIYEIRPNSEVDITEGFTSPSGLVGIGKKYSAFVAPFLRYSISSEFKLEVQPFIRYQFGDKSSYEYNNKQGAPMSQFGINFGLVKQF